MGKTLGFLFAFLLGHWVSAETLQVFCASTASPTTLLINPLSFPDQNDDCDISYNHDCGKIIGRYTLTANLADLHSPVLGEDLRDRFIDTFDEANGSDLEISEDESFTLHFDVGFRQALNSPKGALVKVTSHAVTEGPASVSLFCHIR